MGRLVSDGSSGVVGGDRDVVAAPLDALDQGGEMDLAPGFGELAGEELEVRGSRCGCGKRRSPSMVSSAACWRARDTVEIARWSAASKPST